jgi:hypothetical protein
VNHLVQESERAVPQEDARHERHAADSSIDIRVNPWTGGDSECGGSGQMREKEIRPVMDRARFFQVARQTARRRDQVLEICGEDLLHPKTMTWDFERSGNVFRESSLDFQFGLGSTHP